MTRSRFRALLDVLDFFVPLEVLTSVFLVFVGEMIFEEVVGEVSLVILLVIYLSGIVLTSALRYLTANEDELDDLEDDLDDL